MLFLSTLPAQLKISKRRRASRVITTRNSGTQKGRRCESPMIVFSRHQQQGDEFCDYEYDHVVLMEDCDAGSTQQPVLS